MVAAFACFAEAAGAFREVLRPDAWRLLRRLR